MKNFKQSLLIFGVLAILFLSSISTAFAGEKDGVEFSTACNLSLGESKTIQFIIQNNDTMAHHYDLTVGASLNNYEIYFSSNGIMVKQATVLSKENLKIDLNIRLKETPVVNEDTLMVNQIREDGKNNSIPLTVVINKDYVLSAKNMLEKIEILNGDGKEITFSVKNEGSKALKSVKLETELPYKWIVTKDTNTISSLKPGETGTLKMTVEVPTSQASGNFTAKFMASSDETKSMQISIPVTVKTSSNIALWMFGILILIGGFTLIQFKRHGRR